MTAPTPPSGIAVTLDRVTKRFGSVTAVESVSLTVRRGETVALLGPNGAGKTTAIALLLGLRPPSSGTVRIFGADPRTASTRSRMGAMLQESGVPLTLTVREVVDFFGAMYPDPLSATDAVFTADLLHRADARVATLSGGEKQRLYFAVALVGRPDLLFLDEPTVALDIETRRRFWTKIRAQVARGTTIVLTTHYLEEADALADRVIVIDHGRIIAEGTPEAVKARVGGRYMRFRAPALSHAELERLPGVQWVSHDGAMWSVLTTQPEAGPAQLFAGGATIEQLEVTDAGLEEAFLALTQRTKGAS